MEENMDEASLACLTLANNWTAFAHGNPAGTVANIYLSAGPKNFNAGIQNFWWSAVAFGKVSEFDKLQVEHPWIFTGIDTLWVRTQQACCQWSVNGIISAQNWWLQCSLWHNASQFTSAGQLGSWISCSLFQVTIPPDGEFEAQKIRSSLRHVLSTGWAVGLFWWYIWEQVCGVRCSRLHSVQDFFICTSVSE